MLKAGLKQTVHWPLGDAALLRNWHDQGGLHARVRRAELRAGKVVNILRSIALEHLLLDRVVSALAVRGVFRDGVAARKRCCEVRKVGPLRRAQADLDSWVCGLRRGQGVTREDVAVVEWDEQAALVKVNPLAAWDETRVWSFVRDHAVPYNPLHDAGMPSIGCAPCTRAVAPGEDPRSGRWWWESAQHRECGLHGRKR